MVVDDFRATVSEVAALSTYSGRKMGHIEGKVLTCDFSPYHQDVAGFEIGGVGVGKVYI